MLRRLKSAGGFASCVSLCILISIPLQASTAFEDPTHEKSFFPWLWNDQIKPTFAKGSDCGGFAILLGTSAATIAAHQYDPDLRADYGDHGHMPGEVSRYGDWIGAGYASALGSIAGLIWDQPNGLLITRAVVLTSVSHFAIATSVNRERPNHGPNSFPSGHTSNSFALAGSLAYAYGPWVGVPAIAVATFVGASRIADNAHWFSDTVAAAGLGLFWARASAHVKDSDAGPSGAWVPNLLPGGFSLGYAKDF